MTQKTNSYNYSADIIRSLAIVLVIIIHVYNEPLTYSFDWWFANVIEAIAKVAVPLFIMLSGLLILDPSKTYSIRMFYKKRLSRIGIPLLFWPLFYYFGFLVVSHKSFQLGKFISDYVFLNTFYHLYFLYIIAGLYSIAPFLKKMLSQLDTAETKFLIISSLSFSLLVTILVYVAPNKLSYWSMITVFIPFIGYFIIGRYLAAITLTRKQLVWLGIGYGVLLSITILCKYFAYTQGNTVLIRYLVDALSIDVMLLALSSYVLLLHLTHSRIFIKNQVLQHMWKYISSMSFGIYIIHPLVLYGINKALHYSATTDISWMLLLIEVIGVFSISYLLVFMAKKIPIVRMLFGS